MNSPAVPLSDLSAVLRDADLCVKCGICLPHCPTYGLTGHEADSPRGRIALMQGLFSGALPASPSLDTHLDGCLSCRSCESVCPVKVPFGSLMDRTRAEQARRRPARVRTLRLGAALLTRPPVRRLMFTLLWLYQRSGLQAIFRRLLAHTRLGRAESLLPRLHWPRRVQTQGGRRKISLFTGCTADWLDAQTLHDSAAVLGRLGFEVEVPQAQGCCGALHQHAGLLDRARAAAQQNIQAFPGPLPVLSLASGCGASLLDYPALVADDEARGFAHRVQDVCRFLLDHWPADLALKPLRARVAVHRACTQRNVLRSDAAMVELLRKIPGLDLVELDPSQRCCGAAGAYVLSQPEASDALLLPKIEAARALKPDFIVSANIGCALHLAAGLRRSGAATGVLHPVSLLARCLEP